MDIELSFYQRGYDRYQSTINDLVRAYETGDQAAILKQIKESRAALTDANVPVPPALERVAG